MSINARIGGVWKVLSPRIRVASTWKTPVSQWIKVGGVWKQTFINFAVDLAQASYAEYSTDSTSPYQSRAGYRINSNGLFERGVQNGGALNYSTVETWLEGGSASQADVRIVSSAGTPTGMTSGTWYNCGTTREFYVSKTTQGMTSWTGTIEFRNASTLAALDSASIYIECFNGIL